MQPLYWQQPQIVRDVLRLKHPSSFFVANIVSNAIGNASYRSTSISPLLSIPLSLAGAASTRGLQAIGVIRAGSMLVLIPRVLGVLIPIVHFRLPTRSRNRTRRTGLLRADAFPELQIQLLVVTGHALVAPRLPLALQHAVVVPGAQADGGEGPHDVGDDVVEVEDAFVGDEALQDLGSDAEYEGADEEGDVEGAAAGGVEDPVEGGGEDEEGEGVQGFVVDERVDLERGQTGVARYCEEEEKGTCPSTLARCDVRGAGEGGKRDKPAKGRRMRMIVRVVQLDQS